MSQTLPPPLFDPFAPGFTDDPYPQYAALRAGAPVYRHPIGFWLLTRYEDVSWLLRAGLSVEDRNILDRQLLDLREQMYDDEVTRSGGLSMLDHERIRQLSGTVVRSLEPVNDPAMVVAIADADAELTQIAAGMIAWKRANPADDLLTALINAEDDGDVLGDDELIAQTLLLYIAGHETTVNLIAGGTLALLRHPAQLALLREDPALIGNAVEELLRYDSPVQASRRITLEQVSISGVTIPAGAFVMASLGSANRDESYWGPDAAELRISRENARQHVSFGAGPHHCLGASLARLETSIALARLTARFPGLALDGEVAWNGRINLRGPARLLVSLR